MEVRLHDSVEDFRSVAVEIYRCNPVEATVELMVLRGGLADSNPAPLLVTVWNGGEAVGAAFQTLRFPLLCSGLPEATIGDVVTEIAGIRPTLSGVHGPRSIATQFAAAWRAATGVLSTVSTRTRLFRLYRLHAPTAVAGEPRLAGQGDGGVLVDWLNRFRAETLGVVADPAADPRYVPTAKRLQAVAPSPPGSHLRRTSPWLPDEFLFWRFDSHPVSLAGVRSPAAGVSRIGPCYTPIDRRGHGYASAVTAAAAAWAIEDGADEVVLFTDLANPVTNAMYPRIGFRPVSDFVRIDFSVPV